MDDEDEPELDSDEELNDEWYTRMYHVHKKAF